MAILKKRKTAKPSLNIAFFLALSSVLFCWFFGLPGLVAAIFALLNLLKLRNSKRSSKGLIAFKLKWGYFLAWSGVGLSLIFTVYYSIALFTGAFIRI
jgi:hypothetical protein